MDVKSDSEGGAAADVRSLERARLDELFAALKRRGYALIGPRVRDGAVVYDEIASAGDLPAGWTDVQDAGLYRLERRDGRALFGYGPGPGSFKRCFYPPRLRLYRAERSGDTFGVRPEPRPARRRALIGVRACDLAAFAVCDRVFLSGPAVDPLYRERRADAFLVAVHCGRPGGTCFCASMGTGPRAQSGFDLALTELADGGRHVFVVESGSERGAEVLAELEARPASAEDRRAAERTLARSAAEMGRTLDVDGLRDLLVARTGSRSWDRVAERCLACGNCTLVCPTCFCSTLEDRTDLSGEAAERWRVWDSCFNAAFSYLHGGSVRRSTRSRYRQWLTHKLATWHDQFGLSGCVGCGRCITWCPVGIDITEEARELRRSAAAASKPRETPP